ncbi:hypothetical protein [Paracoccus sp. PAR01]|uniref:hypothetical protein n=1 Tax=Paracoccus sp. PAR01 TaxID=2769282 RepID=UPI00177F74EE|nr:hypothetical protein [Paracoccus sp. PAR01]MBD9529844.1 hypothetical protein [Paracoccus sp. PAR01]
MSWPDSSKELAEQTPKIEEILRPHIEANRRQLPEKSVADLLLLRLVERIPDLVNLAGEDALAALEAILKQPRGKPGAGIRGRANSARVMQTMLDQMKEFYLNADSERSHPGLSDVVDRTNAMVRPKYHGVGQDPRSVNRMLSDAMGMPMTFTELRKQAKELARVEEAERIGGWSPRAALEK